jgi:hypothetical protein
MPSKNRRGFAAIPGFAPAALWHTVMRWFILSLQVSAVSAGSIFLYDHEQEYHPMPKKLIALMLGSFLMVCFVSLPLLAADDDAKPKYKIKDVMKKAMKGPLLKKVAGGNASDAEKKELHGMLVALGKNKPPKGDAESWKKLTDSLVKASQGVIDGDADAGAALKKAANCKACHSKHKGK